MFLDGDDQLLRDVAELADPDKRPGAAQRLRAAGDPGTTALREGLSHPDAVVRFWCCRILDHHPGDPLTQARLVAALSDPNRKVRHAALHTLVCAACKPDGCAWRQIDVVGLLVSALRTDPSLRVRRFAAGSLMHGRPSDRRTRRAFGRVLRDETDPVLRERAAFALAADDLHRQGASRRRCNAELPQRIEQLLLGGAGR
jgi:HEAT repeats